MDAVDRCLDELAMYGPDSKIVIGVDLNCQLGKRETCVGEMAAGERPTEHERADFVYGFLARRVLRAASTFNRSGSTRIGLGLRGEKEAPSQIDFVLCSQGVAAANAIAWIDGALESDHSPICQQLCFLPVNGRQRCRLYKEEVERKDKHLTLPLQWKPRDLGKLKDLLQGMREMFGARWLGFGFLRLGAKNNILRMEPTIYRDCGEVLGEMPTLSFGGPIHHLIREEQRKRKRQRESDEIDRLLAGGNGGYSSLARRPARLCLPTELEGDTDRTKWGRHITAFYRNLYCADGRKEMELTHRLWTVVRKFALQERSLGAISSATLRKSGRLSEVYGTGVRVGRTGCRQMWSRLSRGRLVSGLLPSSPSTCRKRTPDGGARRPKEWNQAHVSMMAKTPQASTLAQFRPISLSCFAQKIWEEWLANYIKLAVEARLSSQQHGFRSGYQSPELVQMLLRIKELAGEWGGTYVTLKVDIRRAFDRISHSSLLISLMRLETSRRPIEAIAEEILFAKVRPRLDSVEADEDIRLFRGVRQGSPLSGLLFIMIMSDVLRPLEDKWEGSFLVASAGSFVTTIFFLRMMWF